MFKSLPHFEFLNSKNQTVKVKLKGDVFIIGSGDASNLRIDSIDVSAEHVVCERKGANWVARAEGHTPAFLDGIPFNIQTLTSQCIVQVGGNALRFVDVQQEKQAALEAETLQNESLEEHVAPNMDAAKNIGFAAMFCISMIIIGLFYLSSEKAQVSVDLRRNTPKVAASVLDGGGYWGGKKVMSLAECVLKSFERVSKVGWPSKETNVYWQLSRTYGATANIDSLMKDSSFDELKSNIARELLTARNMERIGSKAKAKKNYERILVQIPDKECPVSVLALARSNRL